ncbi:glycine zipper 2TM domain-containing protein [Alteraurantiacibacter buctensis]|nr:glycine zipper 2TM domain-containing protein [Alteraurantiacibacter buctensis]
MSMRLALFAAASPLALIALPAQAQVDDRYAGVEEVIETYSEPVVQDIGEWESEEAAAGASYAHGDRGSYGSEDYVEWEEEPARPMHRMRHGGHRQHMAPGQPRQLAYSPEERAEWLRQCRALHTSHDEPVYVDRDGDGDADIIGGVIGAVAGGVIGNRVANRGDRLAGTLIGAGLGGLAGAVVGAVIDGIDDDDDYHEVAAPQDPGFDYCEAYLINYERGYGVPQQMAYAPVMMVPVAQGMATPRHGARRIIEEEIEVEAEAPRGPRRHTARRVIHRQAADDKRTPIN